jgi:peptidoglycan/xylan/chitin deacetylase (PgdA/CDA1 family)
MYHGIQDGFSRRHPYYETNTSPRVFALQMKYLQRHGYVAVDLEEAVRAVQQCEPPRKRVVITFDDGYRDFYNTAYPILKECNLSATVFIITGLTTDQGAQRNGKEYMSWPEVRELHSNAVRIGSHTVSHPKLSCLTARKVEEEISRSKRTLENKIGDSVTSFSYPFAFPETDRAFTHNLKGTLKKHGYQTGVSTVIGTARNSHDRFFLPRVPINTWDDLALFQAKLEGGYDWMHTTQYAAKMIKSLYRRAG